MKHLISFPKAIKLLLLSLLITNLSFSQDMKFFIPDVIANTVPGKTTSCQLVNNFVTQCYELAASYNAIVANMQGLQNSLNTLTGADLAAKLSDISSYSSRFGTDVQRLEPTAKNLIESFTTLLDKGKNCVSIFQIPRVLANMTAGLKVVKKTVENFGTLSSRSLKELNRIAAPAFDTYKQKRTETVTEKIVVTGNAGDKLNNNGDIKKDVQPIDSNKYLESLHLEKSSIVLQKKSIINFKNISFSKLQLLEEALKKMDEVKSVIKKFTPSVSSLEIEHVSNLTMLWNYLKSNTNQIVSDENILDWNEDANKIDLAMIAVKN